MIKKCAMRIGISQKMYKQYADEPCFVNNGGSKSGKTSFKTAGDFRQISLTSILLKAME